MGWPVALHAIDRNSIGRQAERFAAFAKPSVTARVTRGRADSVLVPGKQVVVGGVADWRPDSASRMMESRAKSALGRLANGLKREQHDYRVSLDVFPVLNTDKLAADMSLAQTGAERGAREDPASETLGLDDMENAIVERVEAEKISAHGTLLDQIRTYKERLASLDFDGRFGAIRQAAPAAVTEFRAEASQGRDELHNLRRHLRELEIERDEFRRRHNLTRTAHWASGGNLTVKVGVLLILFVFEVFLNGFFLAKGNELGYLGGASEALTFALLNIGVAFLIAVVGVREINHRNPFRKLFGVLALFAYLALLVTINLSLAHYREVSAAMVSDAGREVLTRLQTAPLSLVDFKSWLLFGLGVLCSLIAFVDSFLIFDPYPGYASLEKRREAAHDAYIRRKNELIERLLDIRDEAIEILEEANRDLSIRRSEHDSILESRARLIRLFAAHQAHLDRAVNALLSIYREANRGLRRTPPPPRFAEAYMLDKIPPEPEMPDQTAREELRRAIAESQGLLAGQIEAIHGEFEQAFASYREIDNFVEEEPVVATSAKAA